MDGIYMSLSSSLKWFCFSFDGGLEGAVFPFEVAVYLLLFTGNLKLR